MIHIARCRNQIHTTVQPGAGDGKLGELSGYSHLSRPQTEQPCRCYSGCRRCQNSLNKLPKLRPVLTKTMYAQKSSMRQQYGTRTPSQTSERSRWQRDKVPKWVLGWFHNRSSVTDMLSFLDWRKLEMRRADIRLLYKVCHGLVAFDSTQYLQRQSGTAASAHCHRYVRPPAANQLQANAFFPRSIAQWIPYQLMLLRHPRLKLSSSKCARCIISWHKRNHSTPSISCPKLLQSASFLSL